MNGKTIACDPNMVEEAAAFVESVAFRGVRLQVNLFRSSVAWKRAVASVFPGTELRVTGGGDPFTTLGASIAEKFARFFDKLVACPIRPQLQWTILRLFGMPKLKCWVSVMPPHHSLPLATKFQAMLRDAAGSVADARIPDDKL
jgi:hypothetical protein